MKSQKIQTVVLVGNPNVGKSSLFYRLTGTHVITGNFPGTTISVTRGTITTTYNGIQYTYEIIDIPGLYSLTEKTTAVTSGALFVLNQADIIINVIDATRLKRNLYLHMQLKSLGKPLLVALNMSDEAHYHGINIHTALLSSYLQCPVISTISITGNGVALLVRTLTQSPEVHGCTPRVQALRPHWEEISAIVTAVQTVTPRIKTLSEHLTTLSVHPLWGTLGAIVIFAATLAFLFFLSSSLESTILTIFNWTLESPIRWLHALLKPFPFLQTFLVGSITDAPIDFINALGMLTTGLYIPIGQVAPPVIAFYATMGLLEDSGYLARLAYVADTLMHRYALHGVAVIPMLMGAGCNVTGIIGTRILENKQQRIITATLIAITVPCASQTGFIVAMASRMGLLLSCALLLSLILIWHGIGILLGRKRRNNYQELILELPPLRIPRATQSGRKLFHRIKNFLSDAIPITIIGIGVVLLLTHSGILHASTSFLFGWTSTLWGLPPEIVPALCMGLFRKEIALSFLRGLSILTQPQAFTATLLLTLWFPCVSVYTILYKEFGSKTLLSMIFFMCLASGSAGLVSHMIFTTFW
jgi:ferrous iron transport protein B